MPSHDSDSQQPPRIPSHTLPHVIMTRSTLWFSDGNIVLRTASKQYRVHRSVLALHSTVFKDMLELPLRTQGSDQETLEGCPVVEVTDSTEDWDELLSLIYHTKRMYDPFHVIPMNLTIAMIRLGHKYDFQSFRDEALDQLKTALPMNEYSWDALYDTDNGDGLRLGDFVQGSEFRILGIAIELGIEPVLPLAYFTCLRNRTLQDIISGQDNEDGPVFLSQDTKNILLRARESILADCRKHVYGWLKEPGTPSDICCRQNICQQVLYGMLRLLFVEEQVPISDAIDPVPFHRISCQGLCDACYHAALAYQEVGRTIIFNQLPSYFALPPWGQLLDFNI